MNVRKSIVKLAAAVTLSAAALGVVPMSPAGAVDGDPSQWLTRKVNEYEGQHRLTADGGDVSQLLTRKVNEYEGQHRLTAGDDDTDVSQLLTRKVNEYEGQHR